MPSSIELTWGFFVFGPLATAAWYCSIKPRIDKRRRHRQLLRDAVAFEAVRNPSHVKIHAPQAGGEA